MIGDIIRAKREAMGLTQAEFAGRIYLSQPYIAQVESGIKTPTVAFIRSASELFGCTTDELIFGESRSA